MLLEWWEDLQVSAKLESVKLWVVVELVEPGLTVQRQWELLASVGLARLVTWETLSVSR